MKIDAYKIKLVLAEMEMTNADLALRCGLSKPSVSKILTRGTCTPKTLGKIAKGLCVPAAEITKEE